MASSGKVRNQDAEYTMQVVDVRTRSVTTRSYRAFQLDRDHIRVDTVHDGGVLPRRTFIPHVARLPKWAWGSLLRMTANPTTREIEPPRLLLHTSGYTSQVEVGDWILCNAYGDVSSMPHWEFQALMEPREGSA